MCVPIRLPDRTIEIVIVINEFRVQVDYVGSSVGCVVGSKYLNQLILLLSSCFLLVLRE